MGETRAACRAKSGTSGVEASVVTWLHRQALIGAGGGTILKGLCERLLEAGIEIRRAVVGSLVFHPQYDAINFTWTPDRTDAERQPIRRQDILQGSTPFFHLHTTATAELRQRLSKSDVPLQFPFLDSLRALGYTDYVAFFEPFGTSADPALWQDLPRGITMHEGVTSSFCTDRTGGFKEREIEVLRALAAPLAVAVKGASQVEMAETLLSTYLGAASGRSVLRGQVRRGQGRVTHAVVWHSDLRGSTVLAQSVPLETYLATLNAYYDCVVDAVVGQGGEVLKFVGDGVLAIFPFEAGTRAGEAACQAALAAARDVIDRLERVNVGRSRAGLEEVHCGIALHAGDVMYGNVGSAHRLDFTVTGRIVNEVVRLESVCKALEEPIVMSDIVASLYGGKLRALGEHQLEGVARSMQVFSPREARGRQECRRPATLGILSPRGLIGPRGFRPVTRPVPPSLPHPSFARAPERDAAESTVSENGRPEG